MLSGLGNRPLIKSTLALLRSVLGGPGGAAVIGIRDAGGFLAAANVEDAIAELPTKSLRNSVDAWILASDNSQRLEFITSGQTIAKGYGSFPFAVHNASGQVLALLSQTGTLTLLGDAVASTDAPRLGQVQALVDTAKLTSSAVTTISGLPLTVPLPAIPAGAKRITIVFRRLSLNGSAEFLVQLGISSGFITTGYDSYFGSLQSDTNAGTAGSTAGFGMSGSNPVNSFSGTMTLSLLDSSTNTWVSNHTGGEVGGTSIKSGGGSIVLGAGNTLSQLRLNTSNATDAYDNGLVGLLIEI